MSQYFQIIYLFIMVFHVLYNLWIQKYEYIDYLI